MSQSLSYWRHGWVLAVVLCAVTPVPALAADGLQAALHATLSAHPAVSGKQAQIKAREYVADAARAQRYPSVSLQAQQYTESNRDTITGEDLSNPITLRARQPLWAFGRIDNSIALADAEVGVEQVDLLRVRRQLLERTAVAYANVLGSRERLTVAQTNLAAHEQLFAQIGRRESGQLASQADVRLAATRLTQAKARVERQLGELDVAQSELQALTQIAIAAEQPVAPSLLRLADSAELHQRAVQNSADILLRREELERAKVGVEQARTAAMPTLFLQAEHDQNQPSYRDDTRVSVVFEGNVEGLGFASRGRTNAARAQQQAAENGLLDATNELTRSLRSLQRNRQLQAELIEVQTATLDELDAVFTSYQRQYVAGTKSWLDVLNIQRELSEQQLQLVQAQSDWVIYSLRLAALTGQLDSLIGLAAGAR